MGILGQSDIAVMFADLAAAGGTVTVVLGGDSTTGVKDLDPRELFGDGEMPALRAEDEVIFVGAGTLSGLATGAALTVDGAAYKAQDVYHPGDGALAAVVVRSVELEAP